MKGKTHQESAKTREAMKAYKLEGHTAKEVAEAFGYTEGYAMHICKGIVSQSGYRNNPDQAYRNQYTSGSYDRVANFRRYIDERTPWFEYAGNCTGIDGYVDLRCRTCGNIVRRSMVTVRHGKAKCDVCARIAQEHEESKKQAEIVRQKLDALRKRFNDANAKQICFNVCGVCGTLFIPRNKRQKYCSTECGERVHNAVKKDRRIRKIRDVIDDKTIMLDKLFDNSAGVCAICGGQCDYEDYEVRDNGTFVAGDNYPSIDHIIPLSQGGRHAWNNVQLACRKCNSRKSDKV